MILTFAVLAALYFALAFAVERGRGRNLDLIACAYRDELIATRNELAGAQAQLQQHRERGLCAELAAQLQDARRTAAHWQEQHGALLKENSTLGVDLARTEREAQHLRAYVRRQNDMRAGVVLLAGAPQVKRMHIADVRLMP